MNENIFKNKQERFAEIKIATVEDVQYYKNIRIEAIETDPDAFDLSPEKVTEEKNRSDKEWKGDLADKNQFTVLLKYNGDAKGMAKGINRGKGFWALRAVYVTPDFRKSVTGSSVAEEMVQEVLNEIKKRKGKIVRLGVRIGRDSAVKIYEKLGFRELSESEVGEYLDLEVLKKWKIMMLDLTKQKDKL